MKNFIQDDELIEVNAPAGGVTSGDGVLVGNLFGVAVTTAPTGAKVNLLTEGVVRLPKRLSATFASCGAVSWDIAAKRCDAPSSGLAPIGVATEAAGSGSPFVTVRMDGVATAPAA